MSNQPSGRPFPPLWHRVGGWLPQDQAVLNRYISKLVKNVKQENRSPEQLDPVIQQFKDLVDNNPLLRLGFTRMFQEVPDTSEYQVDPTGQPEIRDYDTMFNVLDYIIRHAIPYEDNDLVGFPINAILDWPMGTLAGLTTFLIPAVNEQFKNVFGVWARFLSSPDSREYLTTAADGWFGPTAMTHMPNFVETYECDPTAEYYGFNSFDDFFTRQFRAGVRPVNFPEDNIITNACESNFYRYCTNVKETDTFWLKGQPYSLREMLNNHAYTSQFVGGTIYQAFLSAYRYHRWVSPVNGTVDSYVMIPGTYYAESPLMGFPKPDRSAPDHSQGYITAVATRAVVWIKCDNPEVGLMGFMAVGMSEVSTCDVTVKPGDPVKKGEQLGMFHYGGSSHCLLFRGGVDLTFNPEVVTPNAEVLLNAPIATVGKGGPPA